MEGVQELFKRAGWMVECGDDGNQLLILPEDAPRDTLLSLLEAMPDDEQKMEGASTPAVEMGKSGGENEAESVIPNSSQPPVEEERALHIGCAVELHGLSRAELNGRRGTLGDFDAATGRWKVALGPHSTKAIKLERLRPVLDGGA